MLQTNRRTPNRNITSKDNPTRIAMQGKTITRNADSTIANLSLALSFSSLNRSLNSSSCSRVDFFSLLQIIFRPRHSVNRHAPISFPWQAIQTGNYPFHQFYAAGNGRQQNVPAPPLPKEESPGGISRRRKRSENALAFIARHIATRMEFTAGRRLDRAGDIPLQKNPLFLQAVRVSRRNR